jgi:hypothetical protein
MDTRRPVRRALRAALLAMSAATLLASESIGPQTAPPRPTPAATASVTPAGAQAPGQAAPAGTATTPVATGRAPLFRVILNDGTALVSYGEFTRVGDRVVFSMPIGSPRGDRYQLVTLPVSVVNWDSTEEYANATRYAQYMATRGEGDYAVLTGQVAQALSEIGLAKDPGRRLQLAEQTRRLLVAWPLEHYGYRASDIQDMLSLLEGTISQLRGEAGVRQFDFSLVATIQPPTMPLLPDPGLSQGIDQALLAARLSDVPAERMALLSSAIAAIDANGKSLSTAWAEATRALAQSQLNGELRTERRYAELSRVTVARANAAAARADVRAVERVIATFKAGDRALGQQRKDQAASLLALLQQRLDSARRLRLMRDQWALKSAAFRVYRQQVSLPILQLAAMRTWLEAVKTLAGPDVELLPGLTRRFEQVSGDLARIDVPSDMAAAHATLQSAAELGAQAMRVREQAAAEGDMNTAWNASSAAAASMLMLTRARQQIALAARPPEMR